MQVAQLRRKVILKSHKARQPEPLVHAGSFRGRTDEADTLNMAKIATVRCLTPGRQLPMEPLVIEDVEVGGRLARPGGVIIRGVPRANVPPRGEQRSDPTRKCLWGWEGEGDRSGVRAEIENDRCDGEEEPTARLELATCALRKRRSTG
jgi:hypothetical protein